MKHTMWADGVGEGAGREREKDVGLFFSTAGQSVAGAIFMNGLGIVGRGARTVGRRGRSMP